MDGIIEIGVVYYLLLAVFSCRVMSMTGVS